MVSLFLHPPADKESIPSTYEKLPSKETSAKPVSSEHNVSVYSGENETRTSPRSSTWKTGRATAEILILNELSVWKTFKSVCHALLCNTQLINSVSRDCYRFYVDMGCQMSLKIHFLPSHI